MRAFSIILVVCILSISVVCCEWRATKSTPPTKIENASDASITPTMNECSRLATFEDNEVAGWKLASYIGISDDKSLFDYIDGAAELYFAYDFRAAAAVQYEDGKTSIMIDVYDMTSPDGAFGIYSLNRYPEAGYVDIGNEGILTGLVLEFWKGRYFCKVYCFDMDEKYQEPVVSFGTKVASKIVEAGEKPTVITKLPQNGLIPGSEMLFIRKLGLDNVHFISEENVFNLDAETRGAAAEYKIDGARFQLFNVVYPSPDKVYQAFKTYSNYLAKKGQLVSEKTTNLGTWKLYKIDGKFNAAGYKGHTLSGFWDVESQETAEAAMQYIR